MIRVSPVDPPDLEGRGWLLFFGPKKKINYYK